MNKKKKNLLITLGFLVIALGVVIFLLVDKFPGKKEEAIKELPQAVAEENIKPEGDSGEVDDSKGAHTHESQKPEDTIFDDTTDGVASVYEIELSEPVAVTAAYNPKSSTNFRGSFQDERLYALAYGGQFYHFDLNKRQTFTYENYVKEAFVDPRTGNTVYTREIDGSDGKIGVYKTIKENPVSRLALEVDANTMLNQATFFQDFIILSLHNTQTYENSIQVVSLTSEELNPFGKKLQNSLNNQMFSISTDGNRLVAYDMGQNAIVELTEGSAQVIHQFDGDVYGVSFAISGTNLLTSYTNGADESGVTLLNGKKILEKALFEMVFYDENYVFAASHEQLYVLDLAVNDLKPLYGMAMSLSVGPKNLYFINDYGEIMQLNIKKNAD